MAEDDRRGMSQRGWSNVEGIMPKIRSAVNERGRDDNANIDLATAENWLLRPEMTLFCKKSINEHLDAKVKR